MCKNKRKNIGLCEECIFWCKDRDDAGRCFLNPPVWVSGIEWRRPKTLADDFCGEWVAAE